MSGSNVRKVAHLLTTLRYGHAGHVYRRNAYV